MCAQSMPDTSCRPPVACPHVAPEQDSSHAGRVFPTEAVLGGTLGGLSLLSIALLLFAAFRHWHRTRRLHRPHHRRDQCRRKRKMTHVLSDPLFAYDVRGTLKPYPAYTHMPPDVYIARPHVQTSRRLALDPRDEGSETDFWQRGAVDDSRYEPSIIAGSFVYHPPSSLPPHLTPHLTRTPHLLAPPQAAEVRHDLSYDSFKNDHLCDSAARGVASSTLNNQHQPPDFYL
ncbi:uncharacterized protein LOC112572819 [Pomacea canaliculata]|uniref:uncharacterized protein LOC112572819 n=1 Tax=Pomacea canaliculata TaxID=400727 RepID=UPI000D73D860|nr:uncharacterized protein LOC112572819 [Pomacea canaliculata]